MILVYLQCGSAVIEHLTPDRGAAGKSLSGATVVLELDTFILGSTHEDLSLFNWKIVDGM